MLEIQDATGIKALVDTTKISAASFMANDRAILLKVDGREYPLAIANATIEQFDKVIADINAQRQTPLFQLTDTIQTDPSKVNVIEWDPKKKTIYIQVGGKIPPEIRDATEEQYRNFGDAISIEKAREANRPLSKIDKLLSDGPKSSSPSIRVA